MQHQTPGRSRVPKDAEKPRELRSDADDRPSTRPAGEIKELVSLLADFNMDELKQVPIVDAGERLEQNAVYVDLAARDRREFAAMGGMTAEPGRYLVPKKDTPVPFWNRIIGAKPALRRQ